MSNISRSTRSGGSYKHKGYETIAVRAARADDAAAIRRVAVLDGKKAPTGHVIVAEADSEVIAALSVSDGSRVADPFRWTSDVVALMEMRAAQLQANDTASAPAVSGSVRTSLRTA